MREQRTSFNTRLLQIWISRTKKEVFFSEMMDYEQMEFKKQEEVMEYVTACIECGYKVG